MPSGCGTCYCLSYFVSFEVFCDKNLYVAYSRKVVIAFKAVADFCDFIAFQLFGEGFVYFDEYFYLVILIDVDTVVKLIAAVLDVFVVGSTCRNFITDNSSVIVLHRQFLGIGRVCCHCSAKCCGC